MNFLDNNNNIIYVIILIVILSTLLIIFIVMNRKKMESFVSWGYEENSYYPYLTSKNITGSMQYNSQNTLMDYNYYQENDDLKAHGKIEKNRISPLTNGDVGFLTNPTYQITEATKSTRVPSDFSTIDNYVLPNPTTEPKLKGPTMSYKWN